MMDQPTFADVEYESKKRKTRRERFLERMDVLLNPESGENRQKHTWIVRHDGLLFGSGWYDWYE